MADRTKNGASAPTSPPDLRFYGTATPTTNHQLVLPKQAREELSLDGEAPVFIFGSPSQAQAILTASPPPADLMSLLTEAARGTRKQ